MKPQEGEIRTKSDDPNYTKFGAFRQKVVYHVNHFWNVVGAILKEFLKVKQLKNAKLWIKRLSSFIIPKITVVWHVYTC